MPSARRRITLPARDVRSGRAVHRPAGAALRAGFGLITIDGDGVPHLTADGELALLGSTRRCLLSAADTVVMYADIDGVIRATDLRGDENRF